MVRAPFNPFYLLLVLAGIAFTVTATAYGVMAFRAVQVTALANPPEESGLERFLDLHGAKLLGAELAVLAAASLLAMGMDRGRARLTEKKAAAP